jgi:surface protein
MFKDATEFNQTLEDWETSSVVNMARMFNDAPKFESFIRRWRTPNVDF